MLTPKYQDFIMTFNGTTGVLRVDHVRGFTVTVYTRYVAGRNMGGWTDKGIEGAVARGSAVLIHPKRKTLKKYFAV